MWWYCCSWYRSFLVIGPQPAAAVPCWSAGLCRRRRVEEEVSLQLRPWRNPFCTSKPTPTLQRASRLHPTSTPTEFTSSPVSSGDTQSSMCVHVGERVCVSVCSYLLTFKVNRRALNSYATQTHRSCVFVDRRFLSCLISHQYLDIWVQCCLITPFFSSRLELEFLSQEFGKSLRRNQKRKKLSVHIF